MIITRTPFRISFFGGGTDYPIWYNENGGSVLSTTINKYCYINCRYLPPFFNYKHRIRYTLREETQTIDEIKHPAVRECLRFLKISDGIEMVHTSDLPAQSGIGSSSSFTVGFLNALYALVGTMISKRQLALDAIHVEQALIKESVGSQDQVAVAFGGFNKIAFGGEEHIYVQPVALPKNKLDYLQDSLMLYFTGFSRNASEIAQEQIKLTAQKTAELKQLHALVEEAVSILNAKQDTLKDFGALLHESWMLKKELSSLISTSEIDQIYESARSAGALGGKLLGAGGGGFMLLFAPPEVQPRIRQALKKLLYVPFRFETLGSQIVFYSVQEPFV
ncbi:MAG: kinase [Candidatus Omnitrophica bacterium]|nr:kinase [Candidatus Omnitrophota bacterium]